MRNFILFLFLLFNLSVFAQRKLMGFGQGINSNDSTKTSKNKILNDSEKPPINLYKIYTLQKDTTFVDTTLTIQKEYKYNLLRKDIFGLIAFSNEGHTYNTLDFNYSNKSIFPNMGFTGKHFNYLEAKDIKYYNVPTPLSDLYFKTVMTQGQSLDAFLTVNTKPNLNFSIAYKGLRSIGKYINNISSSGNFRFTTSYFTKDERYFLNAHFTGQDISNQENGGITDVSLFETSEPPFNNRERLDVYFRDATSLLKGHRFFIDHYYKLNKDNPNNLVIFHQFNHEYKFFEFTQPTLSPRFGDSFSSQINNKTRYNHLYNKVGTAFTTKKYGDISVYLENNAFNYYYNNVVYDEFGNIQVPNALNDRITSLGGNYSYNINNLKINASFTNSISEQNVSAIEANLHYKINEDYQFGFQYRKLNTIPNLNFSLYQSGYVEYNWANNFKTEKRNQFQAEAKTKWLNVELNYTVLNDYLFFANETNDIANLRVKPFQYTNTINYLSFKASKEFRVGKFALDNTILYQGVDQADNVLNLPQIVTRNTLYFSDYIFKNAMEIQTGIIFNYFTEYYANDYNPLLGEFYVQNETKIGNFPMFDFFINAKVKQTRIFLKAEHFNSSFTGYNFYSAPNYPYRDFLVRFGLVWNFFK